MSTIRVVNLQHTDATEPNIVLLQDGTSVFASGITISGGTNLTVSGTAEFASGTVSAPGVTFIDDNNTGLYSPATDTVAITTAATERLRIDSSGRLLVGTTTEGAVNADNLTINDPGDAGITIRSSSTNAGSLFFSDSTTGTGEYAGYLQYDQSSNYLAIGTNSAERMRIDSSGNVGIGTTLPGGNKLRVLQPIGDQSGGAAIKAVGTAYGTNKAIHAYIASIHVDRSLIYAENQNGVVMNVNAAGNVGIGTSSPTTKCVISNGGAEGLEFGHTSGTNEVSSYNRNTSARAPVDIIAQTFKVLTGNPSLNTGLFQDSSGNVGIGTSNPLGDLTISNGGAHGIELQPNISTNLNRITNYNRSNNSYVSFKLDGLDHQFCISGTERMRIDSSGRLLVGTSIAANQNNASGASARYPSAVFFNTTTNVNTRYTLQLTGASNTQAGPILGFSKTRSSTDSHISVQNGDDLGDLQFRGSDGTQFVVGAKILASSDGVPGTNDMPGRLTFWTTADGASSPTERMRIAQNGHVRCVGFYSVTTASGANMHVESDGDVKRSTSSKKYKTAIEDIENTYSDALLDCRPVWYRSTCTGDNPEHGFWGFIAEEVAKIDPRLVFWKTKEVTYDEKGSAVSTPCDPEPEGVVYDRFVPHLLNLIKRQQAAIETLEQRLSDAGIA